MPITNLMRPILEDDAVWEGIEVRKYIDGCDGNFPLATTISIPDPVEANRGTTTPTTMMIPTKRVSRR